ncbi:DUF2291 domain-containing protein [Paracoccus liaowanqingii]|uniref:DUF2291 domain-containing protein n=1 Tax=Paracoccus liaowanqingii TaxID=2560053 RepID=A0A4Z1CQP4_9RHOB|nr:DUF2291 domain-containing protein [Paracoccus liaowanqingii]TGN67290.1 DUF2291 domain-containing protein [Paracoccus liaowanqingii]
MTPAWTVLMVGALVLLPGCKIVPNPDPASAEAPMDDDQRMAARATQIFDEELPAYVQDRAVTAPDLRAALAQGLDAAGTAHGIRPASEGSPWNFILQAEGVVVEADRESRAAKVMLDTDADGQGDLTVQLGPVIRGTALRDALDFLVFTEFRDQIEFAKLARALNDQAHQRLTLPEGDLTGQRLSVRGAMTLPAADAPWVVVPTALAAP